MALRGLVSCPNLDQMDWERKREGKESKRKREGKGGIFRERSSTFSLSFPAIGPSASGKARNKVALHGKDYSGYQFRGVSTNSGKGRGFSPTCFTFCLRVM